MNVPLPLPNPEDWLSPVHVCGLFDITKQTLWRWSGGIEGAPQYPVLLRRYFPVGGSDPMYWSPEVMDLYAARQRTSGQATR
jgi:hypothetical protein